MTAHRHHKGELKIGSTLSQVALSIHLGRGAYWIRRQGLTVCARGETWEASFYNGGRLLGYRLLSRECRAAG